MTCCLASRFVFRWLKCTTLPCKTAKCGKIAILQHFGRILGVLMARKPLFSLVFVKQSNQYTNQNFPSLNDSLTQLQNSAPNLISKKLSISPNCHQTYPAAQNHPKTLFHNLSTLISINKTPTEISPAKKLSTIKNPSLISVNKIRHLIDKNHRYDIESYPQFCRSYPHSYPQYGDKVMFTLEQIF